MNLASANLPKIALHMGLAGTSLRDWRASHRETPGK